MTVRRLEREMPMAELMNWTRFMRHEPIGGQRLDVNIGHLVAAVCNLLGKGTRQTTLQDVTLTFEHEPRQPVSAHPYAWKAVKQMLMAMASNS